MRTGICVWRASTLAAKEVPDFLVLPFFQGVDEDSKSRYDVHLYESEHSYDDLLELVNDVNKGDVSLDLKVIAEFVRVMLRLWGEELNKRDEEDKMSVRGKIGTGTYAQTR